MPYRVIKSIDGRRGAALIAIAFIFLPISWSQIATDRSDGRSAALAWLPEWIDHTVLGWAMLICSATAFLIGWTSRGLFRKRYRLRAHLLALGFQLMFIPPGLLLILHTVAMILGTNPRGYVAIAAFGGYAFLVYIVAGWEEPRRTPPLTDQARALILGANPSGPVDLPKENE